MLHLVIFVAGFRQQRTMCVNSNTGLGVKENHCATAAKPRSKRISCTLPACQKSETKGVNRPAISVHVVYNDNGYFYMLFLQRPHSLVIKKAKIVVNIELGKTNRLKARCMMLNNT